MEKIISCFLSFLLLIQTSVYSQVIKPTKGQVAEIYNKVASRINSAPVLKDFNANGKITPIVAMSAAASVIVKFDTPEELASWLLKLGIDKDPNAPVYDLLEEAYAALSVEREINIIALENRVKVGGKSIELIMKAKEADPNIIQYYLTYQDALTTKQELNKLGIDGLSSEAKIALSQFEMACSRAKITPSQFIQAYNNCREILTTSSERPIKEDLLLQLVNRLSAYAGNYDVSSIIEKEIIELDALPLEESIEATIQAEELRGIKYSQEYVDAKRLFDEARAQFEQRVKDYRAGNEVSVRELADLKARVDDLGIKYFRAAGRLETYQKWPDGRRFAENGGLFIGVLALFAIAGNIMKAKDIGTHMSNRTHIGFLLQDILEDNKNNLYALIEQLPNDTRDAAFAYIAENYFDDFQIQTENLLLALATLERSSSPASNSEHIQQQFDANFNQSYRNSERQVQQIILNM